MDLNKYFRFQHKAMPSSSSSLILPQRAIVTPSKSSSMAFIIFLVLQISLLSYIGAEPLPSSTERSSISPSKSISSSISTSSSSSSSSTIGLSSTSTKTYVSVTQPTKIIKRANSLSEAKLKKASIASAAATAAAAAAAASINNNNNNNNKEEQPQNRSREALSHEGSERESVVYLSDSNSYVPIASYRPHNRPITPSASGSISSPSGAGIYHSGPEVDLWRPDPWDVSGAYSKRFRYNSTRVQHIEAECQDDYMKIRIGFNGSFTGLLYSAGYAYDPDCMYINGSGRDYYEFYIQLNRCGTLGKNALHDDNRKNPTKNFMWNTITVQYNPLIEEEFDEHFKVTCEYGYDFWKTVTFPFLDVEVATGNPVVFTLSPPECYMEIRNGYGLGGQRVVGPVRVGDPLTLIIYMRSKYDGFDIVVNDCYAHNGATKRIQLIDEYGCPIDDKLISRFRGTWSDTGVYETQIYAYMKTFRFTGSPALYIECDVRMCHGRCPSQPCHWRNLKVKRDVSNETLTNNSTSEKEEKEVPLSENVNLFQSLRVLQEGEGEEEEEVTHITGPYLSSETCIKTSILSALSATLSIILCLLSASLMIVCAKLRYRKKERGLYDTYINHKGQID